MRMRSDESRRRLETTVDEEGDGGPGGLFVGLTTLDLIYKVARLPHPNEKLAPLQQMLVAGGPAANAAVAFSALGGSTKLATALGYHHVSGLAFDELEELGVEVVDLAGDHHFHPPLVTVMVQAETGERSVITSGSRYHPELAGLPSSTVESMDVVLVDGHLLESSLAAAKLARELGIPVVLDAGSWKPGWERLIALVDHAICSETFRTPGTSSSRESLTELARLGVRHGAVSRGSRPILLSTAEGIEEIGVPKIDPVDTLGAGDFLHGAYAFEIAKSQSDPRVALERAAVLASSTCLHFGPRAWIEDLGRTRK